MASVRLIIKDIEIEGTPGLDVDCFSDAPHAPSYANAIADYIGAHWEDIVRAAVKEMLEKKAAAPPDPGPIEPIEPIEAANDTEGDSHVH